MNSLLGSTRRPDITFHPCGKIDISARVARLLSIGEGDVVDVMEGCGEYYLYVRHRAADTMGRHEAACHRSNPRGLNSRAYSKRLCHAVRGIVGSRGAAVVYAGQTRTVGGITALTLILRQQQ